MEERLRFLLPLLLLLLLLPLLLPCLLPLLLHAASGSQRARAQLPPLLRQTLIWFH